MLHKLPLPIIPTMIPTPEALLFLHLLTPMYHKMNPVSRILYPIAAKNVDALIQVANQYTANKHNNAENLVLHSNANSGIINQGGEENGRTLNQRTVYGGVEENAGTGNKSEIRQSGATIDEYVAGGKAEILSRTSSDGQRVVRVNYGNSNVTFTEGKVEDTQGYKVYTAFKNAGMKVIYCEGAIERTVNGKVISRTEALTAPDGTVYVSSESKLPPKQTFDHEKVHVADKTNNPAYAEYEAVLCDEVDYFSEVFQKIAEVINKFQFDNKYDIDDISSYPIFMREIAAYINQFVLSDPTYAQNTFGGMFGDWNAVVEAVNKFNTDMKADFTESASFMPENNPSNNDSSELGFREPDSKSIYRKSTDAETAEGILTGKRIDNKMRHINDIANKLDSGMKIVWCEKNSDKLHGKNGKYVRETNTIYLAKDIGIAQMYHEVFKHEFVHRLESKKAYQAFEKYLFEKSVAFENYARAQLKVIYPNENFETRDDVFENLIEDYYHRVESDTTIPANIRKSFTWADAKREIVADFVGETLFKGKENIQDVAQALSDADIDSVKDMQSDLDLFGEMATDNRTLLQKIIDAIKDFINNLKHVPQNKSLVEDLEYIEQRLNRVYASKDTKKAASQSGGVKYSVISENNKGKITVSMSDNERANILRNKTISNVPMVEELSKEIVDKLENVSSWKDFNALFGKEKRNLIQKLAREFGAFKSYKNSDINLSFEFSNNNYRESFGKQKRNFENFAKMFSVFDQVIESAVGIEVHKREHYKPDSTLKSVYVLMSCFEDGDSVVPVKLEVKEFKDKQNTLYVAISLEAIKKTEVSKQGTTENSVAQNSRSVTISILDLFKKINTKDISFLKYIPDEFLNDEQRNAKALALNDENGQFSLGSPAQQARENRQKYDSGEITLEEYLKANDELWGKANEKFGMLPQGEKFKKRKILSH